MGLSSGKVVLTVLSVLIVFVDTFGQQHIINEFEQPQGTVGKRVPILTFWVPIYISGSLFSVFWQIRAKNVNSVCKHVTMSKLDLCCLKLSFALGNGFHICGTGSVLYC